MSLAQMQVFNDYVQPAIIEQLGQMVEKFNAASGGALLLTTEGFTGDFFQQSFFQSLHTAGRRVDRYAANAAVTPIDLTQIRESAVKVAGGIGPVRYEPSQMTWLNKPTGEGIEVMSRNFAEIIMQDELNTVIACLVAALENQANVRHDISATGPITMAELNSGHALFGDSSSMLQTEVMSGKMFHQLIGQNINNTNRLFEVGNVTVLDYLGKNVVVTDAPALSETGAPNKDKVLTLCQGAAIVTDGAGSLVSNIETNNGNERIETTMQIDYDFGVSMKGYSWDETNGGKSPNDAALQTGANWDPVMTSHKHTAGVITIGQA